MNTIQQTRGFLPNVKTQLQEKSPIVSQKIKYHGIIKQTHKSYAVEPIIHRTGATNENVSKSEVKYKHTTTHNTTNTNDTIIYFNDPKVAFCIRSFKELVQGYIIFSLCSIRYLTANGPKLYKTFRNIFGSRITNLGVRLTFFKHFCLGEDIKAIKPVIHNQTKYNVNTMLDYSIEADIDDSVSDERYDPNIVPTIRSAVEAMLDGIDALAECNPKGYVVIKLTGLCNPLQLLRGTFLLENYYNIFKKLTNQNDNNNNTILTIDCNEFTEKIKNYFTLNDTEAKEQFKLLDIKKDNYIDYDEWYQSLQTIDIVQLYKKYKDKSFDYIFDEQDDKEMKFLQNNLNTISEYSLKKNIKIIIDAEQSYFQPFIDRIVCDFQSIFNQDKPIVWNTYQCYLRTTYDTIKMDLKRAKQLNFKFATKIVRGAYVEQERENAATKNVLSPILDTYEDVCDNYDNCAKLLINNLNYSYVVIATHNQSSIEKVIQLMKELNIKSDTSSISFAQLYGMADHLTFSLGKNNYNSYKYAPYGTIQGVTPYLIRRASENGAMFKKLQFERNLIRDEILRRLRLL